ncbi:MAG: protein-L-isoaspartate(D-aspartate) O-methyltransferase [Acidobacteriota bacterium]
MRTPTPRDATAYARRRMVDRLRKEGIRDERVLDVMEQIPRHLFVRTHLRPQAYSRHALPIEEGQTISQPFAVARMTELLAVDTECSVLEIGSGSGYQTVVLAYLARAVWSLERIPLLARKAIERIRLFELDNVKIQAFDGTVGWSEWAPYDRILVTAGAPGPPRPLVEQLRPGGRMVIPEGEREGQHLVVYDKTADGSLRREVAGPAQFVPLLGRHGWPVDDKTKA